MGCEFNFTITYLAINTDYYAYPPRLEQRACTSTYCIRYFLADPEVGHAQLSQRGIYRGGMQCHPGKVSGLVLWSPYSVTECSYSGTE